MEHIEYVVSLPGGLVKTTCSLCEKRKPCFNNAGQAGAHEDYLCRACIRRTIRRYQEYLNKFDVMNTRDKW